jgi:hypothetical protein
MNKRMRSVAALMLAPVLACLLLGGCQDRRDPVKPTTATASASVASAAPAGTT